MKNEEEKFGRKIWIAAGILLLVFIIVWILKVTFNVLLLLFAGALIAIYFRSLAGLIHRKTKLPHTPSLLISIFGTFLLVGAFFWFTGSRIQAQVQELSEILPAAIENFKGKINQHPVGSQVIEKVNSPEAKEKLYSFLQSIFRSSFGVLGDLYIILFIGIFFTAAPEVYRNGFLKLIPPNNRGEAKSVINKVSVTLAKWLKGQLFAMLVVTILTTTGLLILGVPMAFALALIAGVLNFIPNFGPLIALIPAVLVGFMQDTTTGILVAALYITVQVLESSIITPQIQKKLIDMPPAIIMIAQLFMGVLTGGWGLLLATPLVAIIIVLVQELYIKKQERI